MIANSAASEGCSRWQAGFAPLSFYVMPHEALLVHRRLVAALHLALVSIGFTMAPHGNHRSGESPAQAQGRLSDPAGLGLGWKVARGRVLASVGALGNEWREAIILPVQRRA
jgi:hypothetical protein